MLVSPLNQHKSYSKPWAVFFHRAWSECNSIWLKWPWLMSQWMLLSTTIWSSLSSWSSSFELPSISILVKSVRWLQSSRTSWGTCLPYLTKLSSSFLQIQEVNSRHRPLMKTFRPSTATLQRVNLLDEDYHPQTHSSCWWVTSKRTKMIKINFFTKKLKFKTNK